eukprot:scaffold2668_cov319-Prasinococcus_capsulatus_cf.AAC.13
MHALVQAVVSRHTCTLICRPATPKVSNMISAVSSRCSGGLSGGSVSRKKCSSGSTRMYLQMLCCQKRSIRSQSSTTPPRTGYCTAYLLCTGQQPRKRQQQQQPNKLRGGGPPILHPILTQSV